MIKVKDPSGSVVRGVFRNRHGSLVVSDPELFEKYQIEIDARKRDAARISDLESTVANLTKLVTQLLDSK